MGKGASKVKAAASKGGSKSGGQTRSCSCGKSSCKC
jgi:hypothetical protein